MPKLIDCTARTLVFGDGSTLTVPPDFSDNSTTDSSCMSVRIRPKHGSAVVLEGLQREQVEVMIRLLIDGLNKVEPGGSRPVVVG